MKSWNRTILFIFIFSVPILLIVVGYYLIRWATLNNNVELFKIGYILMREVGPLLLLLVIMLFVYSRFVKEKIEERIKKETANQFFVGFIAGIYASLVVLAADKFILEVEDPYLILGGIIGFIVIMISSGLFGYILLPIFEIKSSNASDEVNKSNEDRQGTNNKDNSKDEFLIRSDLESQINEIRKNVKHLASEMNELKISSFDLTKLAIGITFSIYGVTYLSRYSVEPYATIAALIALCSGMGLLVSVWWKQRHS